MFEEKVEAKLKELGITIKKKEKDSDLSIIFHIPAADNLKIKKEKDNLEKELNAIVDISGLFGMNVLIVESKEA